MVSFSISHPERQNPLSKPSARQAAQQAITEQVKRFPMMPPVTPNLSGLDGRDSRLALAIHQVTLQRYLTLRYLLDRFLKKPLNTNTAEMRGALLTGAAQLLFLDQLPAHAVVDETVELIKQLMPRGKAAGLVNAVLRKVAALRGEYQEDVPWTAGLDRLPHHRGTLRLTEAVLPGWEDMNRHLSVALSHPAELIEMLAKRFGQSAGQSMMLHNLLGAPTVVRVGSDPDACIPAAENAVAHEHKGAYIWNGDRAGLIEYLESNLAAYVQDVASSEPIAATAQLKPEPRVILDLCAGRGTKTRQLAAVHPQAKITATDTDSGRFSDLKAAMASKQNVRVIEFERAALPAQNEADRPDLIVCDVPCSNTGVLARRIEAKYRFRWKAIESLVETQRQILDRAFSLLHPDGRILYSTCSIDDRENSGIAAWAVERFGLRVLDEGMTSPSAHDAPITSYRDGSYYVLLGH